LLRHPQNLVNTLTRRHLEFYYERLLRVSRKAAVPDRVHVLLRLAAGVERARLLEGTLLRAGKDNLGRERVYSTDRELVVTRASVARLSSVYAQKEIVGLNEARVLYKGPREEAILRMLEIALGDLSIRGAVMVCDFPRCRPVEHLLAQHGNHRADASVDQRVRCGERIAQPLAGHEAAYGATREVVARQALSEPRVGRCPEERVPSDAHQASEEE
jgi:hypothetical protein